VSGAPDIVAVAREAAARALAEDLGVGGDITGRAFAGDGRGRVVARVAGTLSGRAPFEAAAALVDERLTAAFAYADGDAFAAGATIAGVSGPLAAILALERTGLNFLARLSGVATMTACYVAETAGTKARIAATRKTSPGLRVLEKAAVIDGGGVPHRYGLYDGAMIKDNHIRAAGGVAAAVAAVRATLPAACALEVEAESLDEVQAALAAGADAILLDNMDLAGVRAAVDVIAGRAVVEVSGGVTLGSVRAFAEAGADIISVGALTAAAPWIDLSFELE
jgi:nicotinate-nucleotide pyrophosphorylase (carboxylating)